MSHPIDVGSVLGGRYKVTATVLTSHDQDLVLDGVDQVLNRPVSILVAGPDNTEQVAQSAREVATGERPGSVQVLDLGVTEAATYLITNHTSAADLLDLVVASDAPYVEPFFTDTLGSEIFGQPRSHEPEPYDDEENVDAGYINYADTHPPQVDPYRSAPNVPPVVPARPPIRPATRPAAGAPRGAGAAAGSAGAAAAAAGGAAAGGAGAAAGIAGGAAASRQQETAPQQVQPADRQPISGTGRGTGTGVVPRAGATGGQPDRTGADKPKVSLWSEDDYSAEDQDTGQGDAVKPEPTKQSNRSAVAFPSLARKTAPAAAAAPPTDDSSDYYEDDEPEREPRSMRWLVGGLLAVVLIAGLVFALTNLGSLFNGGPQANPSPVATGTPAPDTGTPTPNASSSAPPAVPPAIENITRQGNFDFAATYDVDLVKAFDGNAASYWSDMEFATEAWGGLAPDGVPLFVKLKSPATVSSVTLTQLGASGGNLSVYTNDRPSLDGAKLVGTNSFTSTDLTMPLAEPVKAQYVIVSIKTLPRLAAPKTRYGYGIRLAEIKVQ
ncbi:ABC transporter substrate-binding protein [Pseudarthrobacter sp. H3Y2-7]|uniref:ABC transporter substrate-binding protein n=1 Tax=Pseudarthrobacter naphthalenicus TaxID=3031328 RepID=UPI0023B14CA6|nr:ABC transporter substrate-binding protein [Pseudarthrobacter sp. H3Y2-7]MDE8667792.1 ABC transporter substrate-binding protein [Pseudarthrobacter sp. H3Y2-7]